MAAAEGPIKPAVFYILLALAEQERHGYGIMQAVRERSAGRFRCGPAPFYRHLAQLIDEGSSPKRQLGRADDDPRRGTYYRLTAAGHRVLAAERRRLAALVAAIDGLHPASRRGPA